MFASARRAAREFKALPPGERFSATFTEHQRARTRPAMRVLSIVGGVLLVVAGLVALVAPGPGLVMIGLGVLLFARESSRLARFLDRTELAARRWWARRRSSRAARPQPRRD
jgi:hypothetical protein